MQERRVSECPFCLCRMALEHEAAMRPTWFGRVTHNELRHFGPLAVFLPLLERMDVQGIIDRHVPPDPQLKYSHGSVLRILLAARLCHPTALVNVADWVDHAGLDLFWNVPADKLNDDRLGRALDAFFQQRHAIQASVAAHVVSTFRLDRDCLHYDTTPIHFFGAYQKSTPRPKNLPLPPTTSSATFPPAHIAHGYASTDTKMVHAGLVSVVNQYGAVPLFGHTVDGNLNNHTAIAQQYQLLQSYLPSQRLLLISDRGTFSVGHATRLYRAGHHVLCSAPWDDFRLLYDQHQASLHWRKASYLSIEQQRRRDTGSSLPLEHYELAVCKHELCDPETNAMVPCRVIFVYSTALEKTKQQTRQRDLDKIRAGLERLARTEQMGHVSGVRLPLAQRVAKVLGRKVVGRYFLWETVQLSAAERAALPPPKRGCRPPTHCFVWHLDEAALEADAAYDGLVALVTTAPQNYGSDDLFTTYKQQAHVELGHHQWKTPLAVHPLFLKSARRVEALVCLLQLALTAYHLVQYQYRQAVGDQAPLSEQRLTTETIMRDFRSCSLQIEDHCFGQVIHPTQLTARQRHILDTLGFPTPAQHLRHRHPLLSSA